MDVSPQKATLASALRLELHGVSAGPCETALHNALELLDQKLSYASKQLIAGTVITVGADLIASGGVTDAEAKTITLDSSKNAFSLQEAEGLLVQAGYLDQGDWTKALPSTKDQDWSCLTYQLVHEFGHLLDGLSTGKVYKRLDTALSPTRYGGVNAAEAFAEAFAYWLFELDLSHEAQVVIASTHH